MNQTASNGRPLGDRWSIERAPANRMAPRPRMTRGTDSIRSPPCGAAASFQAWRGGHRLPSDDPQPGNGLLGRSLGSRPRGLDDGFPRSRWFPVRGQIAPTAAIEFSGFGYEVWASESYCLLAILRTFSYDDPFIRFDIEFKTPQTDQRSRQPDPRSSLSCRESSATGRPPILQSLEGGKGGSCSLIGQRAVYHGLVPHS